MEMRAGRKFNQVSSEPRRLASDGPVFIMDCGRPAHVLMSYEYDQALIWSDRNMVDLLALDEDVTLNCRAFKRTAQRDGFVLMWLLDTNMISEAHKFRSGKPDANVARWISGKDTAAMFMSVISLQELETAVLNRKERCGERFDFTEMA